MTRETITAGLMVWLIGAVVGWCSGWAGRGEQNKAWHRSVVRQLADVRAQLADALDQLDHARVQCDAQRMPPPAVVHVHLAAAPLPWAPPRPMVTDTTPLLTAMPVLPAQEVTP